LFDLVDKIFTSADSAIVELKRLAVERAVANGEFKSISHDATFKVGFAIIGQVPMAQQPGGIHALHTFVGETGFCPGWSGQRSESEVDFALALDDILPDDAKNQVEMLLSDSPSEYYLKYLPNCQGVGEDPVHLCIRIDGATNERRTALSGKVLKLHQKFRQPASQEWQIYHGERVGIPAWADVEPGRRFATDEEWDEYLKIPFESVEEYIGALRRIAADHESQLHRRDSKGVTVLMHLQRAASHFHYVQNVSVFQRLRPGALTNTMKNEALHRQVKDWSRAVWKCHKERLVLVGKVFGVYKALAHSCLPGTIGLRECWRMSVLAGYIAKGITPAFNNGPAPPVVTRASLRTPLVEASHDDAETRKDRKASQKERHSIQKDLDDKRKRRR